MEYFKVFETDKLSEFLVVSGALEAEGIPFIKREVSSNGFSSEVITGYDPTGVNFWVILGTKEIVSEAVRVIESCGLDNKKIG